MLTWKNGNTTVTIDPDTGTRKIECADDAFKLEFPFNIDIRVSTQCSFGYNPKTGKAICDFCHESAIVNGVEADYDVLWSKLECLPAGLELAVGCNQFSDKLISFFEKCKHHGFIVNITVNQGHIKRDAAIIKHLIDTNTIKGLGISYRERLKFDVPEFINEYPHTVWHVINGIDNLENVVALANFGVKKLLILGEKDFGFNAGRVQIKSYNHVKWFREFHQLFKLFEVVSFDNLGVQQLRVNRFVKNWDEVYQHEHSCYINAAEGYFAPSSRSLQKVDWNMMTLPTFFQSI